MLAEAKVTGRKPLVLDVRNSYEWDAGHFEGAARPLEVRGPLPSVVLPGLHVSLGF